MAVPEVLLNGNHQEIRRWRRQRALEKTLRNRPDLLEGAELSDEDAKILARIKDWRGEPRLRLVGLESGYALDTARTRVIEP